jgi:hypothetical protein
MNERGTERDTRLADDEIDSVSLPRAVCDGAACRAIAIKLSLVRGSACAGRGRLEELGRGCRERHGGREERKHRETWLPYAG